MVDSVTDCVWDAVWSLGDRRGLVFRQVERRDPSPFGHSAADAEAQLVGAVALDLGDGRLESGDTLLKLLDRAVSVGEMSAVMLSAHPWVARSSAVCREGVH